MSINAIPDEVFYDPEAWIDLAPDHDWAGLVPPPAPELDPEPEAPEPDPEPDPEPEVPEPDPEEPPA